MYIRESKNDNKATLDFYNPLLTRMQDMKNFKDLLMRQLNDCGLVGLLFFFLD